MMQNLTNTQHYWLSVGLWLGVLMDALLTAKRGKTIDNFVIQDFNNIFLGSHAKTAYFKLRNELQVSDKEICDYVNAMVQRT